MERPILKALSIPEILDKALQLYRRHARLLLMIGAIIFVPYAAISSIFVFYFNDTRLANGLLSIILPPFAYLALIFAMSDLYLGKNVTIQGAFSASAKRFWSWIGTGLLMGLAMVPAGVLIGITSIGGTGLTVFGLLIIMPVIIFFTTRWSLAKSMVVLENTGASKSMGRSWSLTDGYFWRVFGTSFAAGLLSTLLSTLPSLFVSFLIERIMNIPI